MVQISKRRARQRCHEPSILGFGNMVIVSRDFGTLTRSDVTVFRSHQGEELVGIVPT